MPKYWRARAFWSYGAASPSGGFRGLSVKKSVKDVVFEDPADLVNSDAELCSEVHEAERLLRLRLIR